MFQDIEPFGYSLGAWTRAAIAFGAVFGGIMLVRYVLIKRLADLAKLTRTDIDDIGVDILGRTKLFFMAAMGVAAAWYTLNGDVHPPKWLGLVIWAAVFVQVVLWSNGIIAYWVAKITARQSGGQGNAALISAVGGAARAIVFVAFFLFAVNQVVPITPLLAGLGIGGIAVALALQNVLGDAFGAVSILVDKPFEVGDSITVENRSGTVEHIGLKSTRVRSVDGEQIVFSNADLLRSRVQNFKRMQERRVLFRTHVVYETPYDQVHAIPRIIREIVESYSGVRFERSHFLRYTETALEFETVYWVLTQDFMVYADIHQAINLELYRRFEENGIAFSFPAKSYELRLSENPGATTSQ